MDQFTQYLKFYFGFLIIGIMSVPLFNLVVDPYGIYQILEVAGVNEIKPPFGKQERMVKLLQVRKFKPKGVILGTSRSDYGLDPDHPGWDESSQPVYNLGLSGASLHEVFRFFQYAQESSQINQAVIGLDFFMFNSLASDQINESTLKYLDNRNSPINFLMVKIKDNLLSTLATKKSFKTLFFKDSPSHLKNGQEILRDPRTLRELTDSTLKFYMETVWFSGKGSTFCLHDKSENKDKFAYLKKIINLANINNIDLRLIISPVHAYLLEALRVMGLWPIFEQWKRDLVTFVSNQKQKNPLKPAIQLWDFSGYNTITTEKYPLHDDQKKMQGYAEPAHYTKQVGDLILDRIFGYPSPTRSMPDDFGVHLKNEILEKHLMRSRQNQIEYQKAHQTAIKKIERIGVEIKSSKKNHAKTFSSMISCG